MKDVQLQFSIHSTIIIFTSYVQLSVKTLADREK
jgi:hypothetical protein